VAVVDRLICLAGGRIVGDGEPATVLASPAVREVFLGTDATAESLAAAGIGAAGAGS
jgi:branched-chain amino acid transport system ATP-binding protein